MQPYFFPYPGQFHLIQSADVWVALDTVQYIRHGWMNRNRILHPASGWQYITVPIKKHPKQTAITDIRISPDFDYRSRIPAQLAHYRKKAPRFEETLKLVRQCLSSEESSLSRFNVANLDKLCSALGIGFEYLFLSETGIKLDEPLGPGERVLAICEALGATEYLSPAGGLHLLDREKFRKAGINLLVQDYVGFAYPTDRSDATTGLSIIDAMLWNEPGKIHTHIQEQRWIPVE